MSTSPATRDIGFRSTCRWAIARCKVTRENDDSSSREAVGGDACAKAMSLIFTARVHGHGHDPLANLIDVPSNLPETSTPWSALTPIN